MGSIESVSINPSYFQDTETYLTSFLAYAFSRYRVSDTTLKLSNRIESSGLLLAMSISIEIVYTYGDYVSNRMIGLN